MKARVFLLAFGLLAAIACAGRWTEADTKSATNAAHDELFVERLCAGDGGACTPSQVRALERGSFCANVSMLYSHGQPAPDGGTIRCQP